MSLALSFSGMKDLAISPLHYWARHIDPERKIESTPAQRVGTALHCAILEPDEFGHRYVRAFDRDAIPGALDTIADIRAYITAAGQQPKGTKKDDLITQAKAVMAATGDYRPILAEMEYEFDRLVAETGVEVLSLADWDAIQRMAEAVKSAPQARDILTDGTAEVKAEAQLQGLPIRGKIDYAAPSYNVDLKTFNPRGKSLDSAICDAIYYERYHWQAALYRYLRPEASGDDWTHYMVFVENEAPWSVRVVKLTRYRGKQKTLYWHSAENEIDRASQVFRACVERFGEARWEVDEPVRHLRDEDIKQLAWELMEQ